MKTNLETGYIIEGFDNYNDYVKFTGFKYLASKKVLYHGKTSEIPEEIAKKCVKKFNNPCAIGNCHGKFYDYSQKNRTYTVADKLLNTVKESIQSACNQEYCIIYKEK